MTGYATSWNCRAAEQLAAKEWLLSTLRTASRLRIKIPIMEQDLKREFEAYQEEAEQYENADPEEIRRERLTVQLKNRQKKLEEKSCTLNEYRQYVDQIDLVLASLPEEERTVLEIYSQPGKPGTIIARAEEMLLCGKSQVYRIRDRALGMMYDILHEDDPEGPMPISLYNPGQIGDKTGTSEG